MIITIRLSQRVFDKRLKDGIFEVEDKQGLGIYLVREIDVNERYYIEIKGKNGR